MIFLFIFRLSFLYFIYMCVWVPYKMNRNEHIHELFVNNTKVVYKLAMISSYRREKSTVNFRVMCGKKNNWKWNRFNVITGIDDGVILKNTSILDKSNLGTDTHSWYIKYIANRFYIQKWDSSYALCGYVVSDLNVYSDKVFEMVHRYMRRNVIL